MTRNQEMAIKLLQIINQDDDAIVDYSSKRDALNFWSNLSDGLVNIYILDHHSDEMAEHAYQEMLNEINRNRNITAEERDTKSTEEIF